MTVWSVEPGKFKNSMRVRLSSSRKNKKTGAFETDFSGFCTFFGQAGEAAEKLEPKDRIRLTSCDVTNTYDKEKRTTYVNYNVFGFEQVDGSGGGTKTEGRANQTYKKTAFEEGDVDADDFPF